MNQTQRENSKELELVLYLGIRIRLLPTNIVMDSVEDESATRSKNATPFQNLRPHFIYPPQQILCVRWLVFPATERLSIDRIPEKGFDHGQIACTCLVASGSPSGG